MESMEYLVFLLVGVAVLICLYAKSLINLRKFKKEFSGIIDVDREIAKRQMESRKISSEIEDLLRDYRNKKEIYDGLVVEVSILEEDLEIASFGHYKPHYDFDTSEKFKERLEKIRDLQKKMLSDKAAAICDVEWEIGGNKREGKKMTNKYMKLMLRAFNNECDATILKVRWNNVKNMGLRIGKSFEAVNKLGEQYKARVTKRYYDLKKQELFLTHEYHEKLNEEKEEQRRIKEQIREEEKVQKEIDKALREAEKEEMTANNALAKAKKELEQAHGEKSEKLQTQIRLLQERLEQNKDNRERAKSRAQMTKSGHVYVISNIGSFGENIYKIGMTRRLEPIDRVKELGDASVPFSFDIHAMIFSKDAPALESELHRQFHHSRLNLVNNRKEFFGVTLSDIESKVIEMRGEIEFTKIAEAREYRETNALKQKIRENESKQELSITKFPDNL